MTSRRSHRNAVWSDRPSGWEPETGQLLEVTLTDRQRGGHPVGYRDGYKVIPWQHGCTARVGQTWRARVLCCWGGGSAKLDHQAARRGAEPEVWGACVYVSLLQLVDEHDRS